MSTVTIRSLWAGASALLLSLTAACGDSGSGDGDGETEDSSGGAATGSGGSTGGTPNGGGGQGPGGGGTAACFDACDQAGTISCTNGLLGTCIAGPDGCLIVDAEPCPSGFCGSSDECGMCDNECTTPASECIDDKVKTCDVDANGCTAWTSFQTCLDGACVGNTCEPCGSADIESFAQASCAQEAAAATSCAAVCGVFPTSSCVADSCASEFEALAICLSANQACDLDALCHAFCSNAFGCGVVASVSDCRETCQYHGITYPAACGSWGNCLALYGCGQILPNHCGTDAFPCGDGVQCVPMAYRCDSTPDCADGSDEGGVCPVAACQPQHRDCGSGCIPCPTGPDILGYTCSEGDCAIGSCVEGKTPYGDECVVVDHSTVLTEPTAQLGALGNVIGNDGTRYVLLERESTVIETLWASRPLGGVWSVESFPYPLPDQTTLHMVAGEASAVHIITQTQGESAIGHVWRDSTGWHQESYAYAGAPINNKTAWSVGFDASSQELVVVQPSAARFLRREAAGWVTVPFPAGMTALVSGPSNLVFEGGVVHFALVGFVSPNWKGYYCTATSATGSCELLVNGPSYEMHSPLLSFDASGSPRLAVVADIYQTGGQLTLIYQQGGMWFGVGTPQIAAADPHPSVSQIKLARGDAEYPMAVVHTAQFGHLVLASWTGSGWQTTAFDPGPARRFGKPFVARDSSGWFVASDSRPASGLKIDGALEVFEAGP